ncbi:MAG: hypothetical protein GY708_17360 [Actinomycetia bacterium]|nr:hypothetical protein [Actinomycetes bacterium]
MNTTVPAHVRGTRWLAGIGVVMLTLAAVDLVSARWPALGPGARVAVLLSASALVAAVSTLVRRAIPETARALDVLLATLIPADFAAVAVVAGSRWPVALLSAGPAAVMSAGVLRRRHPSWVDQLIAVGGGVMAACGLAAAVDRPTPVLLALLAFATVLSGASTHRREIGAAWAALAGLAPALRLLEGAVFTGMGTMRDMGFIEPLGPSLAAGVGLVSSSALLIVAIRTRRTVVGLLSAATLVTAGIDIYVQVQPTQAQQLIIATTLVATLEVALAASTVRRVLDSISARLSEPLSGVLDNASAICLGGFTVVATHLAFVEVIGAADDTTLDWGVPMAITSFAWFAAAARRSAAGEVWAPAVPGVALTSTATIWHLTHDPTSAAAVMVALGLAASFAKGPFHLTTALLAFTGATLPIAYANEWSASPIAAAASIGLLWLSTAKSSEQEIHQGPMSPAVGFLVLPLSVGLAIGYGPFPYLSSASVAVVGLAALAMCWRLGGIRFELAAAGSLLVAWWLALGGASVEMFDLYALPAAAVCLVAFARVGAPAALSASWPLLVLGSISIAERADDGNPIHLVLLSAFALAVAGWGALSGRTPPLVIGGSIAVAAASYEAMASSVGHAVWGWLVVGGSTALTAAALIELSDRKNPREPHEARSEAP